MFRNLKVERTAMVECKEKLQLRSFDKDHMISSDQMISACQKLTNCNEATSLAEMCVILSCYYSVSTDGDIRIPWSYKS